MNRKQNVFNSIKKCIQDKKFDKWLDHRLWTTKQWMILNSIHSEAYLFYIFHNYKLPETLLKLQNNFHVKTKPWNSVIRICKQIRLTYILVHNVHIICAGEKNQKSATAINRWHQQELKGFIMQKSTKHQTDGSVEWNAHNERPLCIHSAFRKWHAQSAHKIKKDINFTNTECWHQCVLRWLSCSKRTRAFDHCKLHF